MADPISSGLSDLEKATEAAASGFVAKQEGWAKSHAVPLAIGFGACAALWALVHFVL